MNCTLRNAGARVFLGTRESDRGRGGVGSSATVLTESQRQREREQEPNPLPTDVPRTRRQIPCLLFLSYTSDNFSVIYIKKLRSFLHLDFKKRVRELHRKELFFHHFAWRIFSSTAMININIMRKWSISLFFWPKPYVPLTFLLSHIALN